MAVRYGVTEIPQYERDEDFESFGTLYDDFEIVTVEDESVCVIGIFEGAIAREYFVSSDIYYDAGFRFAEMVDV